jgi:hypothetical protein
MWENIIEYIRVIKSKIRGEEEPRRNTKLKKLFSKHEWLFNKVSYNKKIKTEKIIQDAKIYEILC